MTLEHALRIIEKVTPKEGTDILTWLDSAPPLDPDRTPRYLRFAAVLGEAIGKAKPR